MLATIAALLGACSTYRDTRRDRLQALPQRYSQFDVVMAWETRVVGDKTLVEGVVKNVRYPSMYDLEIWVALLDPAGKVTARAVSFVIPDQLRQDDIAEFTVKLPVPVAPGTRLRFTYKYRGSEGGDHAGGLLRGDFESTFNWMQTFDAVVPAR
jgi:hypothetical protein